MGTGTSREADHGFRVLTVAPNSPASLAGLEEFFDFIVEVNDHCFVDEEESECRQKFHSIIQNSIDRQANLVVFSTKTRELRDVWIVPCSWGGSGLLGATVRYERISSAYTQGVRVLGVAPNSPASTAGLIPYKDYLLGSRATIISDLDELVEIVSNALPNTPPAPIPVTVYNSQTKTVRTVQLLPDPKWGGKGSIGCDIGTGYLHRIPSGNAADPTGDKQPHVPATKQHNQQRHTAGTADDQYRAQQFSSHTGAPVPTGMPPVHTDGTTGTSELAPVDEARSALDVAGVLPADAAAHAAAQPPTAGAVMHTTAATATTAVGAVGGGAMAVDDSEGEEQQTDLERRIAEQISMSQKLLSATTSQGGSPTVRTDANCYVTGNNPDQGDQQYYNTLNPTTGTDMMTVAVPPHHTPDDLQQPCATQHEQQLLHSAQQQQYSQQHPHPYQQSHPDHTQQDHSAHTGGMHATGMHGVHATGGMHGVHATGMHGVHATGGYTQHSEAAEEQHDGQFVNLGGLLAADEFGGNFGNAARNKYIYSPGQAPPRPGVLYPVIPPNQRHHHTSAGGTAQQQYIHRTPRHAPGVA